MEQLTEENLIKKGMLFFFLPSMLGVVLAYTFPFVYALVPTQQSI
jgi:hypothetical protein